MMIPPVRFGAARLDINQSGLDYFVDQSKLYIKYKNDFNTLSRLAKKSAPRLKAMSDQTAIGVDSISYYDLTERGEVFTHLKLEAVVKTHDADRKQTISQTVRHRRLEPLSLFWRRVMKTAKTMDQALARPAQSSEPDKKGNYTIQKEQDS